jgi:uncharacterized membrane protein HdeD (DUF308 family)
MIPIRTWWALALRGVAAVLLGFGAFLLPGITLAVLIALFGAYALIDGFLAIIAGVRAAQHRERYASLLWRGLIGIVAGLVAFLTPAMTAVVLTLLIGIWAVISGVLEFVAALRLHRAHGEWLAAVNGALSVLFGVLLFVLPAMGVFTLIWLIGGYAIFFGVLALASAFRLRGPQGTPA